MFRAVVAAALMMSFAAAPATAADGAQLFKSRCKLCHGSWPGDIRLAGVAGRKIAAGGFAYYSRALKSRGGEWTDANLDAFLKAPSQFAPGTRMKVSVPSDEDRAAIIAYLKTLK